MCPIHSFPSHSLSPLFLDSSFFPFPPTPPIPLPPPVLVLPPALPIQPSHIFPHHPTTHLYKKKFSLPRSRSPDGQFVTCGAQDGSVFVWSASTAKLDKVLREHRSAAWRRLGAISAALSGPVFVPRRERSAGPLSRVSD